MTVYRNALGLTQAQLATRLGVSDVAVSRWESGARRIETGLLPDIARRTGIPAAQLRPDLAEILEVR